MAIRVTVWGENVHERKNKVVAEVYPLTMHGTIAAALNAAGGISASTVTLQDAEHGLTAAKLAETDVLIWWGHAAHVTWPTMLSSGSALRSGAAWG